MSSICRQHPPVPDRMKTKEFVAALGTSRFCDGCGQWPKKDAKTGKFIPLVRCSDCFHAWYHDQQCQKKGWKHHRPHCIEWCKTIKTDPKLVNYPFLMCLQNAFPEKEQRHYDWCRKSFDDMADEDDATDEDNIATSGFKFIYHKCFLPECLDNNPQKRVDVILEFGSSTGTLSAFFLRHHAKKVICFDISPKMIQKVNDQNLDNVEGISGCLVDMSNPTIRNLRESYRGKVDLIVSTHSLSFIPETQNAEHYIAFNDLLKPGGRLFHLDNDRTSDCMYPFYMTKEICETFYEWGGLEKQTLKVEMPFLLHPDVLMEFPYFDTYLLGVAKKPEQPLPRKVCPRCQILARKENEEKKK